MDEKGSKLQRCKRPVRILIGGVHFGCQNVGDEAILEGVVTILRNISPECQLTVLTDEQNRTSQLLNVKTRFRKYTTKGKGGVKVAFRLVSRMLENILDTYIVFRHDVIVCAGGTILSDSPATSIRLASCGVGMNKRLLYFPGGMNSGNAQSILDRLACLSSEFDLFLTRDPDSRQRLLEAGCDPEKIIATADPAFNIEGWESEQKVFAKVPWLKSGVPIVAIGISSEPDCEHHNQPNDWAMIADFIVESLGAYVLFLPSNTEPGKDLVVMTEVHRLMKNGDKAMVIEEELQPKAMITLIEHLELMISSRMHQLMFSAMATTPFVGISRCDKTDSFLSLFNMTAASSTQNCTLARLQPVLESTWRQKEKLRIHIQSVTKNIYARSLETQELVKECLDNMDESSHPERSFVKRLHYLWMAFFMRLGKGER